MVSSVYNGFAGYDPTLNQGTLCLQGFEMNKIYLCHLYMSVFHTCEIIHNHIHVEVSELSQSSSTIYIKVETESVT